MSAVPSGLKNYNCPLYGGGSGNAHTVTTMTEDTLAEGFFIPKGIRYGNKEEFPKKKSHDVGKAESHKAAV